VIALPGAKSAFAATGGFFSADFVACTGGKVWVPNLAGLYAIDPGTNAATRVPVAIRPNSRLGDPGITAANGHVFVRTSDTTVDEVDAATGTIVHTYRATGGGGGQIAVAYRSLWVPNAASGTVWREPIR
jgi:outer membrane protein assembly factor BamB